MTSTVDFELARKVASSYWPARVERITGISERELHRAAKLLATIDPAKSEGLRERLKEKYPEDPLSQN